MAWVHETSDRERDSGGTVDRYRSGLLICLLIAAVYAVVEYARFGFSPELALLSGALFLVTYLVIAFLGLCRIAFAAVVEPEDTGSRSNTPVFKTARPGKEPKGTT